MVSWCKVSFSSLEPGPVDPKMLTCNLFSLPLLNQESGWTCRIKEIS